MLALRLSRSDQGWEPWVPWRRCFFHRGVVHAGVLAAARRSLELGQTFDVDCDGGRRSMEDFPVRAGFVSVGVVSDSLGARVSRAAHLRPVLVTDRDPKVKWLLSASATRMVPASSVATSVGMRLLALVVGVVVIKFSAVGFQSGDRPSCIDVPMSRVHLRSEPSLVSYRSRAALASASASASILGRRGLQIWFGREEVAAAVLRRVLVDGLVGPSQIWVGAKAFGPGPWLISIGAFDDLLVGHAIVADAGLWKGHDMTFRYSPEQ